MFTRPTTMSSLLAIGNLATCSVGAYLLKYVLEWLAMDNTMTFGAYLLVTMSIIMVVSPLLSLYIDPE